MSPIAALALAVIGLVAVLAAAMTAARRLPEALVAVPVAGLLVLIGAVSPASAIDEIRTLGPTVGFLAAILLLAHLCDEEGVFSYAGARMARTSRGDPLTLLGLVFVVASVVTAVLSLDATVVLLTPVVFATAARLRVRPKPHVYACGHLANSASLLLPVSNLTNLLAFAASGLTFLGFTALMAVPWLVTIAVEYAVHRRFFRAELTPRETAAATEPAGPLPGVALAVIGLTLAAFAATSFVDVAPVWPAAVAAAVLGVRRLWLRRTSLRRLVAGADPLFCLFVLALAVTVRAVQDNGLADVVDNVLPDRADFAGLLVTAALAALLANLVNNLPAVLILLPAAAGAAAGTAGGTGAGAGVVLAVLIGVNIGPNLTYVGSLANLLWRRILQRHQAPPVLREYLTLGVLTVPPAVVLATVALWAGLAVAGS